MSNTQYLSMKQKHSLIRDKLARKGIKIGRITEGSFIGGKPWIKTLTVHIGNRIYKTGQKVFWHNNDSDNDFIITIGSFMLYDDDIDILPKAAIMIDNNGRRHRDSILGRIPLNKVELV